MTRKAAWPISALASVAAGTGGAAMAEGAFDSKLAIDPSAYVTVHVTRDGAPLVLRRYDAVYAGKPVAMAAEQPACAMGPGGSPTAARTQTRFVNPMAYLGTAARAAPYWYLRHGMIDRDTSFPIEVALATAARKDSDVKSVDFRLPWMTPHSGHYDVQEAYAGLAGVLAEAR